MKRIVILIFYVLSLTMLVSCIDKRAMCKRLDYVSQCNRADTVFTEAWLPTVDSLVRFFDRHGNGNERMMAHYLKGRVHHDMGEAPIALECYQKAAGMVDTTQKDCDLYTLYAIYGQMAWLFHKQYLPDDEMKSLITAEKIARKDKDTLEAIKAYSLRTRPYFLNGDTGSMLVVLKKAREMYLRQNENLQASQMLFPVISIYLDKKDYLKAGQLLHQYEYEQKIYNDSESLDESGAYCCVKGRYLISLAKADSAIYYFRKAISKSYEETGYQGLLSAYEQKGFSDSVAKYAKLFATANDSNYLHVNQDMVHQISAQYDFNRQRRLTEQNMAKVKISKLYIVILIMSLFFLVIFVIFSYKRYKIKIQINKEEIDRLGKILEKTIAEKVKAEEDKVLIQNAYNVIKEMNEKNESLISQKQYYENRISELAENIDRKSYQINKLNDKILELVSIGNEAKLLESRIVKKMEQMAYPKKGTPIPNEEDWRMLDKDLKEYLPYFHHFIKTRQLSRQEYYTCILMRLGFTTGGIATLLNTSSSRIAQVKVVASEKLFRNRDGRLLASKLKELVIK